MALIFRWLVRIASALILLFVGAIALVYYFASRSLPDYNAEYQVAALTAPVEIVRDNANVPHIFGETDEDVFFALGFAHAQDRLWQMTMLRRTAQGRLSELFGERTVDIDRYIRRLDIYTAAIASVEVLDADTQAALQAYSDGVNAWIAEVNEGALGRGAPEMWLFNHAIAPWEPADSVAIVKLMAVQLSGQMQDEILRARVSATLANEDRLADILPDAPGNGTAALPEYSQLVPGIPGPGAGPATDHAWDPLSPLVPRAFAGASNAWAAGPTRSATGSTLMANDPHLGLTAPSIWYLARLELTSGGVIGGTIPGVPLVMTGRSADLGWGITSSYLDDQDLFLEEVNPADSSQYRTPDGWAGFETRESIIRVADGASITLTLRWTTNGPVFETNEPLMQALNLREIVPPGHVVSLAWPALSHEDTTVQAAMQLMRAHNVEQGIAAAEGYVAPSQMLTLADRNSIGLKLVGRMPARDPDHETRGRRPHFGYLPQNRWQGYRPYDENPEWIDPSGGIVGNTNNEVVDLPFPNHVSFNWGDTQRVIRWRLLMQAREVHTRDSFMDAQLDTVSYTARSLLALVAADLFFTSEPAPEGTPERLRQRALALLSDWNGEMNEHLPEPLIYAAWMRELQDRLIRDELGPLADEFTHLDPIFVERVFRDVNGASAWCDVIQSAPVETCTDIARQALDQALIWIVEHHGRDIESLRWGDAHEAVHEHEVLGQHWAMAWIANIYQSTSGGDNTLMRGLTSGTGDTPFRNVHAAGYRGVYDFADPDSSVFIISTGQSGHLLSRYYDNLGGLWRRGEYIPMSLDPALARGGAVGITVLRPE
ncbi:MAG: penicillin amidase [Rhodobacteraceae bacterium HLUCCA08]|nr:MAG: penicillin amidase [Rhodobacteraceae bacterium HLUCCA08]